MDGASVICNFSFWERLHCVRPGRISVLSLVSHVAVLATGNSTLAGHPVSIEGLKPVEGT